jgi:hypothetical protein
MRSDAPSTGQGLITRRSLVSWPGRQDGRVLPPLPQIRTEAESASVLCIQTRDRGIAGSPACGLGQASPPRYLK